MANPRNLTSTTKITDRVKRAVASLKTWRILHTDYRRPLQTYNDTLHAVIGLHWFTTSQCCA